MMDLEQLLNGGDKDQLDNHALMQIMQLADQLMKEKGDGMKKSGLSIEIEGGPEGMGKDPIEMGELLGKADEDEDQLSHY